MGNSCCTQQEPNDQRHTNINDPKARQKAKKAQQLKAKYKQQELETRVQEFTIDDGMALSHSLPEPIYLGNSYRTSQQTVNDKGSSETEDFPHLTDQPEVVTHTEQFEFAAKGKASETICTRNADRQGIQIEGPAKILDQSITSSVELDQSQQPSEKGIIHAESFVVAKQVGHFEFKQDVTAMLSGITDTGGHSEIIDNVMIGEVSELHPISDTDCQEESHSTFVREQSFQKIQQATSKIKSIKKDFGWVRDSLQQLRAALDDCSSKSQNSDILSVDSELEQDVPQKKQSMPAQCLNTIEDASSQSDNEQFKLEHDIQDDSNNLQDPYFDERQQPRSPVMQSQLSPETLSMSRYSDSFPTQRRKSYESLTKALGPKFQTSERSLHEDAATSEQSANHCQVFVQ